jgi:DnaK suppressor protein
MRKQTKELSDLEQMRKHTLQDIERLKTELQAEIEPASATDDDSIDVAADIYERAKIISLIHGLETKLHSFDRAIAMAAKGTYGICEMCGAEIPAERLEIMPETTVCVRCAGKLEEGARRRQILIAGQENESRLSDDEDDSDADDYEDDSDDYDEDA